MTTESNKDTYIGIDLGTSNSVVSFFKNGSFEQVEFRRKKIIPSALYFESKENIICGEKALKKGLSDPANLLTAFKRDIGSDKKYSFVFNHHNKDKIEAHYIIDTNIFISTPDILNSFLSNEAIHLSLTVQSELSYRATQEDTKLASEIALENIEKILKNKNIFFEESNLDLLPDDFIVNSANDDNDDRILSVAVNIKNNNSEIPVYLLTNDKGLQIKAKSINIDYLNIEIFRTKKNISESNNNADVFEVTPKMASSYLLKYLKDESEKFIGNVISNVVITVPANFTQTQVELTKEAGVNAGFKEIRIMKEPIAAGLAYALDRESDKKILVYDFGGGTFDATLLEVSSSKLEVLGVDGDAKLGGEDITKVVTELIFEKIEDECDLSMFEFEESELTKEAFRNNNAMITKAAEEAKIELSDFETTIISIPNLNHPEGSIISIEFELTRKIFEEEIIDIRKKSLDVVKNLIANSGFEAKDVDMIVMAGGSSNIPSIYNSIKDTLGIDPYINKDTAIVISEGAVIEAIQKWDESNVIQEQIVYNDKSLFDFGIGLKHYAFDVLIPIGTTLPHRIQKTYSTEKDNQKTLELRAFQRKQGHENATKTHDKGIEYVDEIVISNLPPSQVGDFKIKVTFELTKDDVLAMSALVTDRNTNEIDYKDIKIKKASEDY